MIIGRFGTEVVGIWEMTAGGRGGSGIPDQRLHRPGAFAGERQAGHDIVFFAIGTRIVILLHDAEANTMWAPLQIGKPGFCLDQR
jgi:hypothetical protein